MSVDISIVIVTYNQENTILQMLESVKYQMDCYQGKAMVQLIVADDGSKDRTQEYIDRWLKENGSLFVEVDKLFSAVNRGTCKIVAEAYRQIKGKHVLSVSGDDLFMNTDVLKRICEVRDNEIVACPPLKFRNRSLVAERELYSDHMRAAFWKEKDIFRRFKFSCPVINGGMFGVRFYDKEFYSFSEQFSLLDDWTRYFKALEKMKDFIYRYSDEPVLLYRLSNGQVTNKQNTHSQTILRQDVRKICAYILKSEKNPFTRMRIRMQRLAETAPNRYKLIRYLNPEAYWEYFIYRVIYKKKIDAMVDNLFQYGKQHSVEEYLAEMDKRAKRYRE